MKDEKISEKDVIEDLDKMYQRISDIEKKEIAEPSIHKKEIPKPKKKRSSRPIFIVALIVCIILAGILLFPSLKQMIAPQLPKTSTPPPFVAAPPVPKAKPPALPAVPKEQELVKTTPEEAEKPKPVPPAPPPVPKTQEEMKIPPKEVEKTKPILREKYYTIQTGAFHNLEYARDLLEILKKDGFDVYLTKIEGKKRGTFYKVFVGHFKDEKEGTRFLKEKRILNNYPGSFVRKGPSFEIHQLIEEK